MAHRQVHRRVRRRGRGIASAPFLQACLNGTRSRDDHPAVPLTPDELARDAAACWHLGAHGVHVHPRGVDGTETLTPGPCAEAVAAIRAAAPQLEVGLTSGEWIEPDPDARIELVQAWTVIPDVCSVNFSEDRCEEVARALWLRGVAVEAGLADEADAERFLASGCERYCARVLVEVEEADPAEAVARAERVDALVAGTGLARLWHGVGRATWAVVVAGARAGHGVRIGLEDTVELPDGSAAVDNASMVRAASEVQRRAARRA